MSTGWSIFIGLVTVVSILWTLLVLIANAKGVPGESKEHVWDEDLREYNNPLPRWWLFLFVGTILFGFVYLQLYPGMGDYEGTLRWSQETELRAGLAAIQEKRNAKFAKFQGKDLAALVADPDALAVGRQVFAAHCAGCHGQDARGALGFPDLTDTDSLYGSEPATIEASIREGRRGAMPPFGSVLDAPGLALLADTVQHWNDSGFDAARRAAGLALFAQRCAACHGAAGQGNPALGAPDLSDSTWLHGGSAAQIATTIRAGRNSTMPAHQALLAHEEIRAVTAYVLSLPARP